MPLTTAQMRAHIFLVILEKFSSSAERRREALNHSLYLFFIGSPISN